MNQITFSQNIFAGMLQIAQELDLSVNQLLEQINQGKLTIINTEELEDLIDFRDAILAESDPENQERVSWEEVKNNLDL
jgi:hypothetical protein